MGIFIHFALSCTMLSSNELLQAFQQFCNTLPEPLEDLEPLDDSLQLQQELGAKGAAFEPIIQEGSGGFIAFWQEPAAGERPVVWLNGDGSPMAVCANDLAEFLTLLPYGTGLIREVLDVSEEYRRRPEGLLILDSIYSKEETDVLLAKASSSVANVEYMKWLMETAELAPADDPVRTITRAFATHQNLAVWLRS